MRGFYVVGGEQNTNEYLMAKTGCRAARIGFLSADRSTFRTCERYVTPREAQTEDDPAIMFKAATIENDRMYACTETEVMIYQLPDFRRLAYWSLPCFNDVHHVRPDGHGNLLVVSTGLELVVQLGPQGEVLREWNVLGEEPWQRYSRDVDYRKVRTKPHRSHPNYVFFLGEETWVTRFYQQDAICLSDRSKRIAIGHEKPHDGWVQGNKLYF